MKRLKQIAALLALLTFVAALGLLIYAQLHGQQAPCDAGIRKDEGATAEFL